MRSEYKKRNDFQTGDQTETGSRLYRESPPLRPHHHHRPRGRTAIGHYCREHTLNCLRTFRSDLYLCSCCWLGGPKKVVERTNSRDDKDDEDEDVNRVNKRRLTALSLLSSASLDSSESEIGRHGNRPISRWIDRSRSFHGAF